IELQVSANDSRANLVQICKVDGSTPYQKWPNASEASSQTVTLEAGKKYYFEIRQWQKNGSTQLFVRWQLPDGSEERPIPAFRFMQPEK
ncbi:MAG: PA14 domain-containing protein, partial [Limisphaerales bacterium]